MSTVKIIKVFVLVSLLLGCGSGDPARPKGNTSDESKGNTSDEYLWGRTVQVYLNENLWEYWLAYDAGHALMVPLHAAFQLRNKDWISDFSKQFYRFNINDHEILGKVHPDLQLTRLHYLYLAAEYVKLCQSNIDICNDGNVSLLASRLNNEIQSFFSENMFRWYEQTFAGGVKEQIIYKLEKVKNIRNGTAVWPEYRWYVGISDFDLFSLAIIADVGSPAQKQEAVDIAKSIFEVYSSYENNRYVFQPGFWAQHPDYAYAGHDQLAVGLTPKIIDDLAGDSSHEHRMPVFIASLRDATKYQGDFDYFQKLLIDLGTQFYTYVAERSSKSPYGVPVIRNFMDGRNGVYRYSYATVGDNIGYGPYSLSGILVEGWWGFLPGLERNAFWSDLQKAFPLNDEVVSFYVGPNTTRERHYLVKWPEFFRNGFGELNVRLINKIRPR